MFKNSSWRHLCSLISLVRAGALLAALGFAVSVQAAGEPIKIGVIGEESAVAGASITKAAKLAADEINAHGGVDGTMIQIIAYPDHSSPSDWARAFPRAAPPDTRATTI